ncbi:MAG: hypothetical protein PHE55_08880 [Methylococcaceae bacterium]|nr:hypothetical protein [Methylococcaceae bacterium]
MKRKESLDVIQSHYDLGDLLDLNEFMDLEEEAEAQAAEASMSKGPGK